jgi:hypothetical protein
VLFVHDEAEGAPVLDALHDDARSRASLSSCSRVQPAGLGRGHPFLHEVEFHELRNAPSAAVPEAHTSSQHAETDPAEHMNRSTPVKSSAGGAGRRSGKAYRYNNPTHDTSKPRAGRNSETNDENGLHRDIVQNASWS